MLDFTAVIFFICIYALLPAGLVWGWARLIGKRGWETVNHRIVLAAFTLAKLSALLAIGAMIYAKMIGGFPFYDPRLLQIYRYGTLLSLSGLFVSVGGVWKRGPLRWLAPTCSFGMLLYWIGMASTE